MIVGDKNKNPDCSTFAISARSASPPPSFESLSSGMLEWTVRSLGAISEMEKRAYTETAYICVIPTRTDIEVDGTV